MKLQCSYLKKLMTVVILGVLYVRIPLKKLLLPNQKEILQMQSKSKEEASRSTCNIATILEAEFPENKCYQYSHRPSFSGSDYEDYKDGAHHDLEKSYNYVRNPAPNSLNGFQKP